MAKILIIEDEQAMVRALKDAFEHHGYIIKIARDGDSGIQLSLSENPDLLLLDVMLPGVDGFEVCRRLRAEGFTAPILMLTARSEEVDRVVGLEIGADDYIVKPFSTRELLARVKAHLRRSTETASSALTQYKFGNISVDFKGSLVTCGGNSIDLTFTEMTILKLLVENRNKVISREQILNGVWGYETYPDSRTVDTHILNLRHKLEANPQQPKFILTIHGFGYKFVG
jgi:two-component system alkaline phosphatase synthesis response regulator PhoP